MLSRAADEPGMSQPAISAALQRLRHTLDPANRFDPAHQWLRRQLLATVGS